MGREPLLSGIFASWKDVSFVLSLAKQPNQFQYPLLSKPRRVEPGEHVHIFKVKAISLECQEVSGSKIQLGSEEKTPTTC